MCKSNVSPFPTSLSTSPQSPHKEACAFLISKILLRAVSLICVSVNHMKTKSIFPFLQNSYPTFYYTHVCQPRLSIGKGKYISVLHQAEGSAAGETECRGFVGSQHTGSFAPTTGLFLIKTGHNRGSNIASSFRGISYMHRFCNTRIVCTIALVEASPNFLWSTSTEAQAF